MRERLPDRRPNVSIATEWRGHKLTLCAGLASDGRLLEVFARAAEFDETVHGDPRTGNDPEAEMLRGALREALDQAIERLPVEFREVVILRDVQGLNVRETSETLGLNEPLVRTRLLRARLQMRDALAPGYDGTWCSGSPIYKKVRPF